MMRRVRQKAVRYILISMFDLDPETYRTDASEKFNFTQTEYFTSPYRLVKVGAS